MNPDQTYSPAYLAEDRSRDLVNVVVAFAILETFFISLFFTARMMNRTANGWDFYLMVPAYLFAFANIILAALLVRYGGAGRHVVALDPRVVVRWLKFTFAAEITYTISLCFPKLAILCLYKRIFSTPPYRYSIYAIGTIVILTCVAGPTLTLSICRPVAYHWDKSIPNGRCGNVLNSYRYYSVPNIFTDVCILVLPLYGVWQLHMKLRHKIGLTITFLLGCVGMVTGILRLVYFFETDLFADVTYQSVVTMSWTLVEPGVYVIAATLPSLRPLVRYASNELKLETLYGTLLHRYTRTSSAHKYSDSSLANTQIKLAERQKSAVPSGNSAHSAGFVEIGKQAGRSPKGSQEDPELGS